MLQKFMLMKEWMIFTIQYHEQDEELASGVCEWLTWDEYEQVLSEREQEVIMDDDPNS